MGENMTGNNHLNTVFFVCLLIAMVFTNTNAFSEDNSFVDQQQTNVRDNWYIAVGRDQEVAQVVTPAFNGYLEKISVLLNKIPGHNFNTGEPIMPGDVIVETRLSKMGVACIVNCEYDTTTAIIPSERVLTSTMIDEPEIAENSNQWYEIRFDNPAFLCAEVPYALVLGTNEVPGLDYLDPDIRLGDYRWPVDADQIRDPYPRGHLIVRSFGTNYNWLLSEYWNEDTTFITYMNIVKSPSIEALSTGFGISECRLTDPCCGDQDGDGDVDGQDIAMLGDDFE